jgi:hypothetical protein
MFGSLMLPVNEPDNVVALNPPRTATLPVTTNLDVGVFVPIPTLPVLDTNR